MQFQYLGEARPFGNVWAVWERQDEHFQKQFLNLLAHFRSGDEEVSELRRRLPYCCNSCCTEVSNV